MKLILNKSDNIGVLASTLCMLHCFATPLLFIAQTSSASSDTMPIWWKWIDYFFLTISFFAIYRSTQITSKNFMKSALWINWIILLLVILNEKAGLVHLPEVFTYAVASSLVILHLYNQKYCQCKNDKCYTHHE